MDIVSKRETGNVTIQKEDRSNKFRRTEHSEEIVTVFKDFSDVPRHGLLLLCLAIRVNGFYKKFMPTRLTVSEWGWRDACKGLWIPERVLTFLNRLVFPRV